jgi:hypothetical protein
MLTTSCGEYIGIPMMKNSKTVKSNTGLGRGRLTTKQISRITGATMAQLGNWMERKYIKASVRKASGYGTKNLYSFDDAYRIMLFTKLIEIGLSRENTAEVVNQGLDQSSLLAFKETLNEENPFPGWLIVQRRILDGKEKISAYRHHPGQDMPTKIFNDLAEQEETRAFSSERHLEDEIWSSFRQGIDYVWVINIEKIISEADDNIRKELSLKKLNP